MSWLSKLTGIHLGNIGAPIGAALGSFIPGVGTAIGAGLGGALGGLGHGDGVAKSALEGATAYGGTKLAGAIANHMGTPSSSPAPSSGTLDPSDPNVDMNSVYGSDTAPQPTDSGWLSKLGGVAKQIVGGGPGGGTSPLLMGLAGLQGANSAYLGNKANNFSNDALTSVKGSYAERAPLRSAAISGLTHPVARDTSELTRIRGANAYASPAPLPLASGRVA